MQTLEEIKRRIKTGEDLQSVVRTMKTLAAVNIRHYEKAVEALTDYTQTVEMGLYAVLRAGSSDVPVRSRHTGGRLAAIVFGSDQGLCGRFNDQIATYTLENLNTLEPRPDHRLVVCVGERVRAILEAAGQPVEELFAVPGSLAIITLMIQDILLRMEDWQATRQINRVVLFYNRIRSGVSYAPHTLPLLPIDQAWLQQLAQRGWPTRVIPAFTMDRSLLFSTLIRQYLFVSLYRACAESMASENASRFASMQAAEGNIGERLEEFHAQLRHERQNSITEELLDIVSGFEALTGDRGSA